MCRHGYHGSYETDPPLQKVLKDYKIYYFSLWRALHRYDPTLAKTYKVEHRPYRTTDTTDNRIDTAAAWLRKLVKADVPGVCACMKRLIAHTLPAVLKAGGHWPPKKFR